MLLELRIVNLATILDQTIEFGPGFNIITGETGAGKSVIIAGLGFVLGDRLKPDMLRTGADRAMVEARFYTPEGVARSEGGEPPEEELIIRRELLDNGRSKAFVNDRGVTVTALHDLRVQLVEIHGQHDHQALLDERRHIDFVDAYGDLMPQRAAVKKLHVERRILRERRRRFEQTRRERRERILLLRFLSDEIDRTAPRPGEIEELEDELNRLQHAEQLRNGLQSLFTQLFEMDGSVSEHLGGAVRELERLAALDGRLADLPGEIQSLAIGVEEMAHRVREYAADLDDDPLHLQAVDDRLHVLKGLQRKHHMGIEEILRYRREMDGELTRLAAYESDEEEDATRLQSIESELTALAEVLSSRRREVGERLRCRVETELHQLDMKGARFEVAIRPRSGRIDTVGEVFPDPAGQAPEDAGDADGRGAVDDHTTVGPDGMDQVEFLLSANPGEALKPLARVASGGELSRIMLALKHAFVLVDHTPTMVFDEIDAGIGGQTAESVGLKLSAIADRHQVLCITHLPQIAAMASNHFVVCKSTTAGRTLTSVRKLTTGERTVELARMLEGERVSKLTSEYAETLLQRYQPAE